MQCDTLKCSRVQCSTVEDLQKIRAILQKGWSRDTSYVIGTEYDGSVRSLGQCYVTARVLQHVFGWEILHSFADSPEDDKTTNHFWNRLPCGLEVDLTSDQMGGDGIYPVEWIEGKPRRFKPLGKCKSINPRLRRLLKRVEQPLRDFLAESSDKSFIAEPALMH